MVSWFDDGLVSGISGGISDDGAYHLASDAVVDVQGITRLQYPLPGVFGSFDSIRITVPLNFVSSDFTSNPGRHLTATAFVVPTYYFANGAVPTPQQILDLGTVVRGFRSTTEATTPGDLSLGITIPRGGALQPNTEYWVLVVPTASASMSFPANVVNDQPMNTTDPTNPTTVPISRGVSMWTNRTPNKPAITSPATNTSVASGVSLTFTYTPSDDDSDGTSSYLDLDLAGAQIQYAPRPTPDNPNPTWIDLPFGNSSGTAPSPGWYIDQQIGNDGSQGAEGLWISQTTPIQAGDNSITASAGMLPAGQWQLRVRTFDYGHPRPDAVPPLALAARTFTPDSYPAANTSPWSDTINVEVQSEVPPPIATSPTQNVAIPAGVPVTLEWQYRNTHVPPLNQAHRTVQIRKVGDPDWVTVVDESSAGTTYQISSGTIIDSWDFDINNAGWALSTWSAGGRNGSPGKIESPVGFLSDRITITPGQYYDFSAWATSGAAEPSTNYASILWRDSAHAFISSDEGDRIVTSTGNYGEVFVAGQAPVGSASAELVVTVGTELGRLDDALFRVGAYLLVPTTEYEWRVQVTDTGSVTSNWSETARFWIVPAPASGGVSPIPSRTIDGATLGCGTHRVFIYRRGGTERVGEIRGLTHVDWSRVRDDISTSQIVVQGWDIDCGNLLAILQCWAYEIVIFRDNGFSNDRVWEGPITLLTYEIGKVTIQAKDVMGYAYRRIIKQAMNDLTSGDTITSRAGRILQNVFAPDDPNILAYLNILAKSDDAQERRDLAAYSRTAFEEIDDMAANAGLDYTCVGRSILVWDTSHRIGLLPEFRDKDLGSPPIVSEYGMSMANLYATTDGSGSVGVATAGGVVVNGSDVSAVDPIYGLIEILNTTYASDSADETGTYTGASAADTVQTYATASSKSLSDRYPSPVVVRVPDNTSLNPDCVVSIQQLVPGVAIPLRSTGTLRTVMATQKLDSIKVVEESGAETITVTMSPFNGDDALTQEEATDV